jgi:hypothetical protein
MPASQFKDFKETHSPEEIREFFNQVSFDYHTVVVRAKIDDFN